MAKRDGLKLYIELAREAYQLGRCPALGVPPRADEPEDKESLWTIDRIALLSFGLDIKYIIKAHLDRLAGDHGSKRVERFKEWLDGRPLSSYSWWNRKELLADRDVLERELAAYRGK